MSSETREAILVALAITPWLLFLALIAWSAAVARLEERARRVEAPSGADGAGLRDRKRF